MGIYYKLANHTKKEILDFEGAKLSEQHNDFDRRLLQTYLQGFIYGETATIAYISDEGGEWDKYAKYEDITTNVLVSMFEDGFVPTMWQIGWIYERFKEKNKLSKLGDWLKEFDKKTERK